jgi:hypothetical protein
LRDRAERQKQPHADIDVQESEQENNRTWESHRKKVGAKAGTSKTCGKTRGGIVSIFAGRSCAIVHFPHDADR